MTIEYLIAAIMVVIGGVVLGNMAWRLIVRQAGKNRWIKISVDNE